MPSSPDHPQTATASTASKPAAAARTVILITLLHAFTHGFHAVMVPLYLMIRASLNLPTVNSVALIVTVYYLTYWSLSYFAGVLTDRLGRRKLLAFGLIGNAAAIALMGITHNYSAMLGLAVMAGVFGTIFHPAANSLATAHYPRSPGMLIGLVGIGAGLGFFFGPQYSGWRAAAAGWERPMIEMGCAGVVVGLVFLFLARETGERPAGAGAVRRVHPPMGRALRGKVLWTAVVLGWRDFASQAVTTLASLFLQKVQGRTVAQTGLILGTVTLSSVVVNPVIVWISPRGRRLPALIGSLLIGAAAVACVPHVSPDLSLIMLGLFQTCCLASFALGDAAILERVAPSVRGRVVGLFLSLAATLGATAPWIASWWTDQIGAESLLARGYNIPFAIAGSLMVVATFSAPLISRLGRPARDEESVHQAEAMAMMSGES